MYPTQNTLDSDGSSRIIWSTGLKAIPASM